ncbi:MAG: F0F1 ATP synthase subunit delta, partial [Rhodobiaceae bacterium]|nr:F0F1 ATP synthase subunit delta [Rhodobiaceae bacterium]
MKSNDQSIPEAANRYAKALFQLAEEENSMNSVSKDLDGFLKAVESSEDLS